MLAVAKSAILVKSFMLKVIKIFGGEIMIRILSITHSNILCNHSKFQTYCHKFHNDSDNNSKSFSL